MSPRDRRRLPNIATRSAPRATTQARLTTAVPPPTRRAERVTHPTRVSSAVRRRLRKHSAGPRRRHRERTRRGTSAHRNVARRRSGMPSGVRRLLELMLRTVRSNAVRSSAVRSSAVRSNDLRPALRKTAVRRIPRFVARRRVRITESISARTVRARTLLRRMRLALPRGKRLALPRDAKLPPRRRDKFRAQPNSTSPSTTTSLRAAARSGTSA